MGFNLTSHVQSFSRCFTDIKQGLCEMFLLEIYPGIQHNLRSCFANMKELYEHIWCGSYWLVYSITHRVFLWFSEKLQVSLILICFFYLIVIHVGKICKEQKVILHKTAEMTRCKLWSLTVTAQLDLHTNLEPCLLQNISCLVQRFLNFIARPSKCLQLPLFAACGFMLRLLLEMHQRCVVVIWKGILLPFAAHFLTNNFLWWWNLAFKN